MIVEDGQLALVRRVRAEAIYFLFPGGGVEADETPRQAAVREAREELGVDVALGALLHEEVYAGERYLYFEARIVGGEFGTGSFPAGEGVYEPVWLPLAKLRSVQIGRDVRPRALLDRLLAE